MEKNRIRKIIAKTLGIILLITAIGILLMNSQCTAAAAREFFHNEYLSFYINTKGLRAKESGINYFTEQKTVCRDDLEILFIGYASPSLQNKKTSDRSEELENILLDMMQDEANLFCYDHDTAAAFLEGKIDGEKLKQLLFVGYTDEETKQIKQYHRQLHETAQRIEKTITKDPLEIDTDFLEQKRMNYKNGLLQKSGVPYRIIPNEEYLLLKKSGYPLCDLLLREKNGHIINILPNCAQGATQILFHTAQYTKVSQIIEDKQKLFMKLKDVNSMQIGDCIAVLWDAQAGATSNSGHIGVIVDLVYSSTGNVLDGKVIEFFPANHAPRVVTISNSMYGNWKSALKQSATDSGIFLLRAVKNNRQRKYDTILPFLKQKYPNKKSFVVF
ncbi:MAG: hypothetical protein JW904_04410 [Spirochaetales bacterium]|nr:hypothetical protein [Spirochaetales bacterium]